MNLCVFCAPIYIFPRKIHLSKLLEKCIYRKQRETFHLTSIVIQNLIPTSDETDDIILGTNGTPSTNCAIKKEVWNNTMDHSFPCSPNIG